MLYSMVPASMVIMNLILNWDLIWTFGFRVKNGDEKNRVPVRYNYFILTSNIYLLVDMTWGLLYEHCDVPQIFHIVYSLTVFYFLFMLLTMLTWTRYIVAYLNKSGRRSTVLLYGVWIMVIVGVVCLVLNRFFHFMFSYNEAHEYVGETGRNISFLLQIMFYAVISVYTIYVAHHSTGRQKTRYHAVAASSIVIGVFLIFQILFAFLPSYAVGLMIGMCFIHTFVESDEKKEKKVHDHIASVMAEDYEAIFYIEKETGEYLVFAKSQKYESLNVDAKGKDFFKEAHDYIDATVFVDDREYARSMLKRETLLKNLEGVRSFSFKYRLMIAGEPRFFLFTVMYDSNSQYLIFYEKDIQSELDAEIARKESQNKTVTFSRIAEGLASNYDVIYYVDIADSSYVGYEVNNIYGQLEISQSGEDFYADSFASIPKIVHKSDCDKVMEYLTKDNMISALENRKDYCLDYRLKANDNYRYTRMSARKTSDGTHFIIGVEDVDSEVKREREQLKALKTEKELARRDELTGVKNKTAYKELEESVQGNIDNGMDYLTFALVVCDANNLKQINDTLGHAAGDEYIKASARLLCEIFVHSPVFRVGGDEFVVFLRGNDYVLRYELIEKLRSRILENKKMGSGVILACGMSEYKPENDSFVSDIFERADKEMYENKQKLKA